MNDFNNTEELDFDSVLKKRPKKKVSLRLTVVLVAASAFVSSIVSSILFEMRYMGLDDTTKKFEMKLSQVNNVLQNEYLYDINSYELAENAVAAYVEGLDEPYTRYYPAAEFESFTSNLEDSYVGIGVVISATKDNRIEVVSPFEGSPAAEAGILPGDILRSVNGVEYDGNKMDEAVNVIRSGTAGTTVDLVLVRNGSEIAITVARGSISSESVTTQMLDNNIGYVRISAFNTNNEASKQDTYTEFRDKVTQLQKDGMKKMIIDVRDNPGGSLSVVCEIADMLLPKGTITYMEYKDGKRRNFVSDENELNIPMAVLINGNSASASEVLTGALKDYNRAVVIGQQSYGKGIVQSVYDFADGSGLSLTVARYFSPSGVCIHETGIAPDIEVDMPEKYDGYYAYTVPQEEDTQLQKAIEELNK